MSSPEIISFLEAGKNPKSSVKLLQSEEQANWAQQTLGVLHLGQQRSQHSPGLQWEHEVIPIQEPLPRRRRLRSDPNPGQLEKLRPRPVSQQRSGVWRGGSKLPLSKWRGVCAQRGQRQGPGLWRSRVSNGLKLPSSSNIKNMQETPSKIREQCNLR